MGGGGWYVVVEVVGGSSKDGKFCGGVDGMGKALDEADVKGVVGVNVVAGRVDGGDGVGMEQVPAVSAVEVLEGLGVSFMEACEDGGGWMRVGELL